jgi:hypothetical protein
LKIRFPENGSSYVAIMPPPDAVVSSRDQVFVFLSHVAAECKEEEEVKEEEDDDVIINNEKNAKCDDVKNKKDEIDEIIINLNRTPTDENIGQSSSRESVAMNEALSVFTS